MTLMIKKLEFSVRGVSNKHIRCSCILFGNQSVAEYDVLKLTLCFVVDYTVYFTYIYYKIFKVLYHKNMFADRTILLRMYAISKLVVQMVFSFVVFVLFFCWGERLFVFMYPHNII